MTHTLGDAPVQVEYVESMKKLAHKIDYLFNGLERPKKVGFLLMVFPFDTVGLCNYMSNAERADVLKMLKEQVARFEADANS